MYSFSCDYLEGCHPEVLKAIVDSNMMQEPGYGADSFTKSAKEKIRKACHAPEAQITFVNGGTQTNQLVIDTMLAPYEGVLSATTGHVNAHEAGAIEFSGHKVLALPSHDGKVKAEEVEQYIKDFYADGSHTHMVFPGMLYVSHPTEYGTLYTKAELMELSEVCKKYEIHFFLDGARLGYGLTAENTDVTLPLIASLVDVFYIGGTKVGALNGEAIVFPRGGEPKHFETQVKQHGALSAKGRLVGIQFDALFTDDLYLRIARHGIEMAMKVKKIFEEKKISFYIDSPTNQQFVILEDKQLDYMDGKIGYGFWEKYDENHTVVRFATSWATTEEGIKELQDAVEGL